MYRHKPVRLVVSLKVSSDLRGSAETCRGRLWSYQVIIDHFQSKRLPPDIDGQFYGQFYSVYIFSGSCCQCIPTQLELRNHLGIQKVIYTYLHSAQFTLYNVHCTMYTIQCRLYNVDCTMYTVQCTLHNIHCTMYTVQCTLYYIYHYQMTISFRQS